MNRAETERYTNQIKRMALRARAWSLAHPDVTAKVQFNYPKEVMLISTWETALSKGAVMVDDAGAQLVAGSASPPTRQTFSLPAPKASST